MEIIGAESIVFNDIHGLPDQNGNPFGYMAKPRVCVVDFIGEHAGPGFQQQEVPGGYNDQGNPLTAGVYVTNKQVTANDPNAILYNEGDDTTPGGMTFDQIARGCHAMEVPVFSDNLLTTCAGGYYDSGPEYDNRGLPIVAWDPATYIVTQIGDNNPQKPALYPYVRQTPYYSTIRWGVPNYVADGTYPGTPVSFRIAGTPCVACQGFKFLCKNAPAYGWEQNGIIPDTGIMFRVGGSGNTSRRWYAVSLLYGLGIQFSYNDVTSNGLPVNGAGDVNWILVDTIKPTAEIANIFTGEWPGSTFNGTDVQVYNPNSVETPDPPEMCLDVKFLGGRLQIQWNGITSPLVWHHEVYGDATSPTPGSPDWYIDEFIAFADNSYLMEWSCHPKKWSTLAVTGSLPQNAGFQPASDQPVTIRAHYLPAMKRANDDTLPGIFDLNAPGFIPPNCYVALSMVYNNNTGSPTQIYQYLITMVLFGVDPYLVEWADFTPLISAVEVDFVGMRSPTTSYPMYLPSDLDPYGAVNAPHTVEVTHSFDIDTLTFSRTARMTFNNFEGLLTNGQGTGWLDYHGHFGVSIGLQSIPVGYVAPTGGPTPEGMTTAFTGIANTGFSNTWAGGARDEVVVECEDFMRQLDRPLLASRYYDLMNFWYVMSELAQLAGFSTTQIGWYSYVPQADGLENPFGPTNGGGPDMYLGSGLSGTQVSRIAPGESIREAMVKISRSFGMALYCDQYGVMQCQEFLVSHDWNNNSNVNWYSFVAGLTDSTDPTAAGQDPGWDEAFEGTYTGNLHETRNQVLVIGPNLTGKIFHVWNAYHDVAGSVNALYDPNGSHIGNTAYQKQNYLGFPSPFVWVDNQFADPNYADQAAQSNLDFLSTADREVHLTGWHRPDQLLQAGMLVTVVYPRSGVSQQQQMFITSTTVRHEKGKIPTQSITARIVPADL